MNRAVPVYTVPMLLALLLTSPSRAETTWAEVGRIAGVDPLLIYSIALTESAKPAPSGKGVVPWPWTLNTPRKKGEYFDSYADAKKALDSYVDRGWTNIDIGLGQINWRWNGRKHTKDPAKLLDPSFNLRVAASVLRERLEDNAGALWLSVGEYHNPRNPRRDRYARKVERIYNALRSYDPHLLTRYDWHPAGPEVTSVR